MQVTKENCSATEDWSQSHVYIKTKNYYLLNCQEHISKFSHEMKFLLASFTVFSHIIIFGY